jgi:hypothetical protein
MEQPQPRQPECGRNFFFNENTGDCEPVMLKLPRACPQGTIFSRMRQRCVPVFNQQNPTFAPEPNNEPSGQLPTLKLNRNIFKQPTLDNQCPAGTFQDKNGRCVPVQ